MSESTQKTIFREIDPKLAKWRKNGKHLPEFLRDFHNQKDVFRAMHALMKTAGCVDPVFPDKETLNWANGHVYVIDTFLWFMARHGYTLQRSRAKLEFESLGDKIAELSRLQSEAFAAMLQSAAKPDTEMQDRPESA